MKISVVIPAHNEEKQIGKVVKETKKYVDKIIVVDDGSKDKTKELAKKNKAVVSAGGASYEADLSLVSDIFVGDYVLLHAGYALQLQEDWHGSFRMPHFRPSLRYYYNDTGLYYTLGN